MGPHEFFMLPFEARAAEAERIREGSPSRVPVLVVPARAQDAVLILPFKFLASASLLCGEFIAAARSRAALPPSDALFWLCGNRLIPLGRSLGELAASCRRPDGWVEFCYSREAAFGGFRFAPPLKALEP